MTGIKVERLFIHPVKSCRAIEVKSYELDRLGPKFDRRWCIAEDEGRMFVTLRKFPKLATIVPVLDFATGTLTLTAPGVEDFEVPAWDSLHAKPVKTTVWGSNFETLDLGPLCTDWLKDALGKGGLTIVTLKPLEEHKRGISNEYGASPRNGIDVGFADGYPFLLANQASVEAVSQDCGVAIEMERFRPNIVVSGAAAWEEDVFDCVQVGKVVLDFAKPCDRCTVPTVSPKTGVRREDWAPRPSLLRLRKDAQSGAPLFGINMNHRAPGNVISVGDEVQILKTRIPPQLAGPKAQNFQGGNVVDSLAGVGMVAVAAGLAIIAIVLSMDKDESPFNFFQANHI
eukprot:Clim_evm6s238 gene=Clim_evmTU6s238